MGVDRDVFILDVATREVRQITRAPGDDASPSWSPDGRSLAFTSDRNGIYNLYVADLTTDSVHAVTDVLNGVFSPHWSPAGRKVAFSAFTRGGFDIYVMSDSLLSRRRSEPLAPAEYVERRIAEQDADSTSYFRRPPLAGPSAVGHSA